jgi:NAD(P)-dependent dehydrogenase (short-subunit alcohol dehydrogenase family)
MSERVAVVTAASRGMGAGCARELARRGYRVAVMARTDEVVALAREIDGLAVMGSVSSEEDLRAFVDSVLAEYGRIDAVVNNTGHPAKGDLLDLDDSAWRDGVDLLLLSVIRMARLVTPVMERQAGGAIVNISSLWAVEPHPSAPVSSVLRAALSSFTKLYADRYASAGIRMNSVLPGFVETYPVPETILNAIPMRRPGTVEEIAQFVAFLLSPEAGYITGQSLRADGGLTRSV